MRVYVRIAKLLTGYGSAIAFKLARSSALALPQYAQQQIIQNGHPQNGKGSSFSRAAQSFATYCIVSPTTLLVGSLGQCVRILAQEIERSGFLSR